MNIITPYFDAASLKGAIEAVEDNNDHNGGSWADWDNPIHITSTHGLPALGHAELAVLQRAINTNGYSLRVDLPAVERAVWGQNYAGSFWDRREPNERLSLRDIPHFERQVIADNWKTIVKLYGYDSSWRGLRAYAKDNHDIQTSDLVPLDRILARSLESALLVMPRKRALRVMCGLS